MRAETSPFRVIRPTPSCDGMENMTSRTVSAPSRFLNSLSAEVQKARTLPAIPRTLLFGAVALLAAVVFTVAQASRFLAAGRGEELGGLTPADVAILLMHYGQIVPILLGAWVIGQDLPVGPRQSAFLATARRGRLITVKLITTALVALIAGVVCTVAALVPLAVAGGGQGGEVISLKPYGWLIGYWVLIAVVSAALVAATRSIAFTVAPILIWTIGVSDLLAAQIPALDGALDQVFKSAYLQGGAVPSASALLSAAAQLVVTIVVGVVLYVRRDVR